MISSLDHITLATVDVAGALAGYAAVLGRDAQGARLQLDNVGLEIADQPRAPASADDPPPPPALGLVFAVESMDGATHKLARRGLPSGRLSPTRIELDRAATHGVAIGLIERAGSPEAAAMGADYDILGLDHVVVRTRDPERAVALYGGRLGLDLRLDRTNPERGNRLLFFVCGDLVVEVSHDIAKGVRPGPDGIWGLAWRSRDTRRSHARMGSVGVAVSEIRTGNRPGTEVFTVKSHTAGVPTLVIGGQGLERK